MNKETKELAKQIIEAIQEKKGSRIVVADLSGIPDTICKCFVICQGNSPTQVEAIAGSVSDYVREHTSLKPIGVDGLRNASWIAMDYNDIFVHIFLPEEREFYDLEHLWADAELTQIPEIN